MTFFTGIRINQFYMAKKNGNRNGNYPLLERDVSWMYFNRRVLQEACRKTVPLLERLTFLGIYSNNLDEFFRVRVASQNRVAGLKDRSLCAESSRAKAVVKQIGRINARYIKDYESAVNSVYEDLEKENIHLISDSEVDGEQLKFIHSFYREKIEGLVMPVWFSSVSHLDYESDASIYMAVKANRMNSVGNEVSEYAYFELPVQACGRFIRLPDKDGGIYIMYLDDIVRCSLTKIFHGLGFSSFEAFAFKFTRDAEMEIDDDRRSGLMQKISKGLKSRKKGEPLRVVYDADMPGELLRKILNKLDIDKNDTVLEGGRYQNHKDLMKFPDCGRTDLRFAPMPSIVRASLDVDGSILNLIAERDRFLHVPYHSFSSFLRVLQEAAIDKNVKAVKITLYRLARDSRVVKALIAAARNGKKVTVVIELLARFDEESNIEWSQKLQEAGVKVLFGVEGLKVHSKVVLIERKRGADIACISTGNFHEGNARSYTDCILMTASKDIVKDVSSLFDFIEKPYIPAKFRELLVSPNEMKRRFLSLINAEIRNHAAGKVSYIKVKVNHVTDPEIIERLYDAALAGVRVELLVRGNCSIVTDGLPSGMNLKVCGIIDRFLEHSRIFVFAAGGRNDVFIGSADWMPRNLDNRVEVVTPVYDPEIKDEMIRIVDSGLRDVRQGRLVDGSGRNQSWTCGNPLDTGSQEALYRHYCEKEERQVE